MVIFLARLHPIITNDLIILILFADVYHKKFYAHEFFSIEKYSALHGYQLLVEFDTKYSNCSRHNDVSKNQYRLKNYRHHT